MPEIDFNGQAQGLRQLLDAHGVLYWRREEADLAMPLGVAPAGAIAGGFLPPACPEGVRLLRGKEAYALVPLRMRGGIDSVSCITLAGSVGQRGGILAVWRAADEPPPACAEAIMAFALDSFRPQLDFADADGENERSAARRLSGMADALPQGVIVVPAGNRPGYINAMASALLGLPHGPVEASLLAAKLGEFARQADDPELMRAQVEPFIAGHGDISLSGQVWRFHGRSPGALRVTVAPIDRECSAGWFWLLEDVTAAEAEAEARERQRRLEWINAELEQRVSERTQQLEHANEVLLQANIELQHFAHAMAHDLQTPLRSIVGFAQLAQARMQQYGDREIDDWSAQVVNNAKRLQTLIQGLLAYARLDARAIRVEPADMNRVFDEVVGSLQVIVRETGAVVGRGELPTLPCVRTQIGQVLQNLIENGIKYNRAPSPKVFVSCRPAGDGWEFTVADNGMGIDPKHHDRVFGMFSRLHAYGDIPGTGIGLALCRRIVERHGGRIWVESREGEGATFHFTLPAERSPAPTTDPALSAEGG
ncbi:MAG TPA: ATP-binding protein [Rhodocyclaceae bacterium]|nr:ATP-binding protein [Rhodocyclaceae bacterium]